MEGHRQYLAALSLLNEGAIIEQMSGAPITYRLKHAGQSVPLTGGVFQQLIAHRHIRQSCRLSGRVVFVPV
ncbi:conserved hypothetical protein [Thiomonas arsenitoxydans]|uniref:Uncharacterized protein n=1 Tax=Thiomonas arsenitoxydans (strain DSM 22701 / CIP 110005 / 3As) TaxID=426114 RepID=D6CSA9_THIA3|nr:hypothetical protein [Thiomonas arsenitoxydans]CAZ87637.1 Hypothetical protein THI_0935 [Thiomonas arsenitoxydans]CQR26929.1 conserved hypothetical protein [Thiomonas arsenitoxydans]CQR30258.1 conserved hypothetical protein [Thiomonas arsenitoxydans]CQR30315.1 conserved hypothetical protein [Thiomonas arsenitoxydans]CQR32309.1 conserved hypothetical protein [Thiomonas arsenitoxydans]